VPLSTSEPEQSAPHLLDEHSSSSSSSSGGLHLLIDTDQEVSLHVWNDSKVVSDEFLGCATIRSTDLQAALSDAMQGRTTKLTLPLLARGDGDPSRAIINRRRIHDLDTKAFVEVNVYDRQHLAAGDAIAGPALIHQFDSTTVLLAGQILEVQDTGTLEIREGK
jgi:hypothetical protein